MKKFIKIFLIVLSSFLFLVVLAGILIPLIYKDDIQKALNEELDRQLNATVFYDTDNFDISFFRNFPNLSLRLGHFGIVGKDVFSTDTLVAVNNFYLTVDLSSLFDKEIKVNKIHLNQPTLSIVVLEDGTANYDIAKESEEVEESTQDSEDMDLKLTISSWEISQARVKYYDQDLQFYTDIKGLNHTGSGNFQSNVFDMVTNTSIDKLSLGFEGVDYIHDKKLTAAVTMLMDMDQMKFDFKENYVALNDFKIGFDGYIALPQDDIKMDLTFEGKKINLKNLLTLVPKDYQQYLKDLEANGQIDFNGFVKGLYNDAQMPHVNTTLAISNGTIAHSTLPDKLNNIQTQLVFDYPTPHLKDTNLKLDFSSEMTGKKSNLHLFLINFDDYQWDLTLDVDANLEKISKLFPLPGTDVKGLLTTQIKSKGKYSDIEKENWTALTTSGFLRGTQLYFKSADIASPLNLEKVNLLFNPQQIKLENLDGNIGATDFKLQGFVSNYINFAFSDKEVLKGQLTHQSQLLDVDEWIPESQTDTVATQEESEPLTVIRIPENITFNFQSDIKKIKMMDLALQDFVGKLSVKDGKLSIDNSTFQLLEGQFKLGGNYDSKPKIPTYNFDFNIQDLSIAQSFDAFSTIKKYIPVAEHTTGTFSTHFLAMGPLKEDMMPDLEKLNGKGAIHINKATVKNIEILDEILKATQWGNKKANEPLVELKDINLETTIENGDFHVKPFEFNLLNRPTVVSGKTNISGNIDYKMAIEVENEQLNAAINNTLAQYIGKNTKLSTLAELTLGITGTYKKPKVKVLSLKPKNPKTGQTTTVKQQAKEIIKEKAKEQIESIKKEVKKEVEKQVKKELEDKAKDLLDGIFKKKKK